MKDVISNPGISVAPSIEQSGARSKLRGLLANHLGIHYRQSMACFAAGWTKLRAAGIFDG
jgi:hypothetical protein